MALCVCGHGPLWHVRATVGGPGCEACECTRFREQKLPPDGQHDGDSAKRAEGGGAIVSDHPHRAEPAWERCNGCGLAQAAHAESLTPYLPAI